LYLGFYKLLYVVLWALSFLSVSQGHSKISALQICSA